MGEILRSMRFTPHVDKGKTLGLRISNLQDGSVARLVGLEDGDIIEFVNGQRVTSLAKAYQVMRKARALNAVDIQIMRGEKRQKLSIGMK